MSDKRTTFANLLHKIADLSSFDGDITQLSSLHVKKNMTYAKIPDGDKWRIGGSERHAKHIEQALP